MGLIGSEDGTYFPRNKAEADSIGGYKYLLLLVCLLGFMLYQQLQEQQ